jgi:hypothetical protein
MAIVISFFSIFQIIQSIYSDHDDYLYGIDPLIGSENQWADTLKEQERCGEGIHYNANGQINEVCNPPDPGGDGVEEIYPTKLGGETWFLNPNNLQDGQFDPKGVSISKNPDGSWHVKPETTRMLTFTKSSGTLSDQVRGTLH